MKCLFCENEFQQKTVTQKFCSQSCKKKYHRSTTREERLKNYPSIEFNCSNCGVLVVTDSSERIDMRTRFCCRLCEKQYWRRQSKKKPTHLTNHYGSGSFHSLNKKEGFVDD
ncbi:MAG: hypothetical protein J6K39_00145 [Clostridia bacterium]|nr:hypothetical protein [Clostridia bacterium]